MKPRLRAWLVPYGPFVTFPQRTPQSGKVKCSVCGASGYDTSWNGAVAGWQKTHLRGHKPCGRCGRMMVVLLDGSTRVHTRCPS